MNKIIEKNNKVDFNNWLQRVKKEQNNYPYLKGKNLDEKILESYYQSNYTPIDALNDLLTAV